MMEVTRTDLADAALVLIADKEGHYRWSSDHPDLIVARYLADVAKDIREQKVREN